jgi:hypothetical protein
MRWMGALRECVKWVMETENEQQYFYDWGMIPTYWVHGIYMYIYIYMYPYIRGLISDDSHWVYDGRGLLLYI